MARAAQAAGRPLRRAGRLPGRTPQLRRARDHRPAHRDRVGRVPEVGAGGDPSRGTRGTRGGSVTMTGQVGPRGLAILVLAGIAGILLAILGWSQRGTGLVAASVG